MWNLLYVVSLLQLSLVYLITAAVQTHVITSRPQHIVSYALFPVKKGEQLSCAYADMNFISGPKIMRQRLLLEQYHFFCRCIACEGTWFTQNAGIPLLNLSMIKADDKEMITEEYFTFICSFHLVKTGDVLDKPYIIEKFLTIIRMLHDRRVVSRWEINSFLTLCAT